jgi:glycosyltransferase involved in cell wall biosynthesis
MLLAGGGPLTRKEKKLISNLAVQNSVIQVSVNSRDLPSVYSNALCLVYPSRYEGFGLPLVEAMASGLPILAANTAINTEISGNCASYFQVGNLLGLSELMLQVGLNQNNFQDKVKSGLGKAKGFTWERCAELTAAEYRRTIERLKVKG